MIVALKCPHCSSDRMAFRSVAAERGIDRERSPFWEWTVFLICEGCQGGVCTEVRSSSSNFTGSPDDFPHYVEKSGFTVTKTYPKAPSVGVPEHLPDNVSRFFIQAKGCLQRRDFDAAGMMCRKALEATIKEKDPGGTGKLFGRIESLHEKSKITPDLKEWAHAIRESGNDASHETEPLALGQQPLLSICGGRQECHGRSDTARLFVVQGSG
jgi:hypothetical protein